MKLTKIILSAAVAAAGAFALSSSAASAATRTTPIGTSGDPYFNILSGTASTSPITATFGATATGAFDDDYTFTLDQVGVGSGSVSTSFSGANNQLTINGVTFNGTSYTAAQAAAGISGIPVNYGMLNTLEIFGTANGGATGIYSGTATFTAVSGAPEPAAWVLMIGGLGLVGVALRRRHATASFA